MAVLDGAVKCIRPQFMTVSTDLIGLLPVMLAVGAGSEVMKRMAAPIIGGLFTSFALELLVYPVVYETWKWHTEVKPRLATTGAPQPVVFVSGSA